jgi:hypothetical protein
MGTGKAIILLLMLAVVVTVLIIRLYKLFTDIS